MKKKKGIIIAVISILVIVGAVFAVLKLTKGKSKEEDGELVYTELVSNITDSGYYLDSRYMGVVESQEVKNVDKASDKKVKEILVSEGDMVEEGDALFAYDTEDMTLTLRQLELELTSINNNISNANAEIATLNKERNEADSDEKIQYTAQIQSLQAQVNQYYYDASSKQLEIDRQKAAIENNEVYAPMSGIIKEINEDAQGTSGDNYDYYGGNQDTKHFISIMAVGDYRIKATSNEMNVRSMYEGMPMLIRSRIDDSVVWTGVISSIDLEHPENDNNNGMYYMESQGEQATKYPFYISLDSTDGLMLGQHVYVEADYGQGEVKDGLWLYDYYIMQEDDKAYVWVENSKGRVEKREVTLGSFDEMQWAYEITAGLTKEDYIAFPEDRIKEGMKVTHNYDDVMQYYDDMYDDYDINEGLPEGYYYDDDFNLIDPEGNVVTDYYFDENGELVIGTYDILDDEVYPDEVIDMPKDEIDVPEEMIDEEPVGAIDLTAPIKGGICA